MYYKSIQITNSFYAASLCIDCVLNGETLQLKFKLKFQFVLQEYKFDKKKQLIPKFSHMATLNEILLKYTPPNST